MHSWVEELITAKKQPPKSTTEVEAGEDEVDQKLKNTVNYNPSSQNNS